MTRRPAKLDLMGVTEVAHALGISRQRVTQLRHRHPLFPRPVAELFSGPVWYADDIRAFAEIPRPTGRPRKKDV
jgi:hypothetical protein